MCDVDVDNMARICANAYSLDEDDLRQEFAIILIERAPQFAGATRAYIAQRLKWEASHLREKRDARCRMDEPLAWNGETDYDVPDKAALTPEEILIVAQEQAERQAMVQRLLDSATLRQEQIIRRLMAGERKSDIAARLGVSKTTISGEIKKLRLDFFKSQSRMR